MCVCVCAKNNKYDFSCFKCNSYDKIECRLMIKIAFFKNLWRTSKNVSDPGRHILFNIIISFKKLIDHHVSGNL